MPRPKRAKADVERFPMYEGATPYAVTSMFPMQASAPLAKAVMDELVAMAREPEFSLGQDYKHDQKTIETVEWIASHFYMRRSKYEQVGLPEMKEAAKMTAQLIHALKVQLAKPEMIASVHYTSRKLGRAHAWSQQFILDLDFLEKACEIASIPSKKPAAPSAKKGSRPQNHIHMAAFDLANLWQQLSHQKFQKNITSLTHETTCQEFAKVPSRFVHRLLLALDPTIRFAQVQTAIKNVLKSELAKVVPMPSGTT